MQTRSNADSRVHTQALSVPSIRDFGPNQYLLSKNPPSLSLSLSLYLSIYGAIFFALKVERKFSRLNSYSLCLLQCMSVEIGLATTCYTDMLTIVH